MAKNNISFDEVKSLILTFAKEHPGWTAIGAGIGFGVAYAGTKWGPYIENVGKYAIDKASRHLHISEHAIVPDDSVIDANTGGQESESATT